MATKEIIVKAGEILPDVIEAAIHHLFGPDLLVKVKGKGAKVKLTVASPWPKPLPVKRVNWVIDETLVARLKLMAVDEVQLEAEINKFNGPEILKIAALLNIPMSKNSKVPSLRAQLLKSLRSEIVWKSIAGQPSGQGSTESEKADQN